jgi:hypothetical protein
MRPFCDGLIRPCTNQAKGLLFGTTRCGQARGDPLESSTRVRSGCGSRSQYATGRVYQPWSFLLPLFILVRGSTILGSPDAGSCIAPSR